MEAISFPEQNVIFNKPESMTDEECGSLPAYRGEGQIVSCWKLSLDDLEKVQETGGYLAVNSWIAAAACMGRP